jgi:hypothetical protein
MLYALVNSPAERRKKVAKHRRKKASRRHHSAGRRRTNTGRRTHRRRNAGAYGGPKDWLALGGGAVIGGLGATSLPQLLFASSNTGLFGYALTVGATGILAVAAHYLFKRPMLTAGVIAGGGGALIRRVIQDYSLPGSALLQQGMGDIVTDFNFSVPRTIAPGLQTLNNPFPAAIAPAPVNVGGVPSHVMAGGVSGYYR